MAAYFWIKLYTDLLDDLKVGPLPEFIKWRFTALLLIAAEHNQNGLLPPVDTIAWRLRLPCEKARETLIALGEVGVVKETPEGWLIVNYTKRQMSLDPTGAERQRRYRNKQRYVTRDVTDNGNGKVTRRIESDIESEKRRRAREPEPPIDNFSRMQELAEMITGLPALPSDIPILEKWIGQGVIEQDIRAALQWRVDTGKREIHRIQQLDGGVETARNQRVQSANARASPNGSKPSKKQTPHEKTMQMLDKLEKELKDKNGN